jgi:anti-sigma factor NepR-like protein
LALKRGISASTGSSSSKKLYRKMGQDNSGDSGAKPVDARVARRRQDAIGRRLRQMYDDVLNENVPNEFMAILGEADANKRPKPPGDGQAPEPVTSGASGSAAHGRTVKSDH